MKITARIYTEALYESIKAASEKEIAAVARRLLKLLRRRRQWALLPKIARAFEDVLFEREGLVAVELTTARAHSATHEKDWVKRMLDEVLPAGGDIKRRVELVKREDAALIGGVRMKSRGYVYDASVRALLKRLREQLANSPLTE